MMFQLDVSPADKTMHLHNITEVPGSLAELAEQIGGATLVEAFAVPSPQDGRTLRGYFVREAEPDGEHGVVGLSYRGCAIAACCTPLFLLATAGDSPDPVPMSVIEHETTRKYLAVTPLMAGRRGLAPHDGASTMNLLGDKLPDPDRMKHPITGKVIAMADKAEAKAASRAGMRWASRAMLALSDRVMALANRAQGWPKWPRNVVATCCLLVMGGLALLALLGVGRSPRVTATTTARGAA